MLLWPLYRSRTSGSSIPPPPPPAGGSGGMYRPERDAEGILKHLDEHEQAQERKALMRRLAWILLLAD